MPREATGSYHGCGLNNRLAPQRMSPRLAHTIPRLTELGKKSRGKGKAQDDQTQASTQASQMSIGGESPPLLSPIYEGRENTAVHPFPPLGDIRISNGNNNESQLTTETGLMSASASGNLNNQHDSSDDDDDGDYFSPSSGNNNNDRADDDGINFYSATEYPINERVSYFMGRIPITSTNRMAVETVYMIEAYTIVRSAKTMKKPDVAMKVQATYKELINLIPTNRFSDFGLKDKMLQGYFRAKTNSPAGLLTKAEDSIAKARVMATKLKGFGTPLHEIPSGKSLMDVKESFILEKYKEHLGEVGCISSIYWLNLSSQLSFLLFIFLILSGSSCKLLGGRRHREGYAKRL